MRPSIERLRIAGPAYSMTWPVPPAVPILPMMARIRSFAVTPSGRAPSTAMRIFLSGRWISVWVASTCSTSDVPMPKASAPKAPWVAVWLSPHTMVEPGRVRPCSGPMICTMPWRISSISKNSMPYSSALLRSRSIWICASSSSTFMPRPGEVGTLWSATVSVRSGRRTPRPFSRRPSKAWALVISCTRCRSI